MKPFILGIVLAAMVFLGVSAMPGSTSAGNNPNWPDLAPGCFDISGDGLVDLSNDILGVVLRYQAEVGDPDYALVYDVSGGGTIDLSNDILGTILAYNTYCDLTDTQVVRASLAIIGECSASIADCSDLRDYSNAVDAGCEGGETPGVDCGYIISSQYVGQMGIHLINQKYQAQYVHMDPSVCDPRSPVVRPQGNDYDTDVCQLEHPVGLVYTSNGGAPDQLIGGWYLVPNEEVCDFYGHPNPSECLSVGEEPVGFGVSNCGSGDAGCGNPEEDNGQYTPNGSEGWHDHQGLCIGNAGTTSAWVVEVHLGGDPGDATAADEADCLDGYATPGYPFYNCDLTGCFFFYTYGWMMHLYNIVPNPVGRFMQWNPNLN